MKYFVLAMCRNNSVLSFVSINHFSFFFFLNIPFKKIENKKHSLILQTQEMKFGNCCQTTFSNLFFFLMMKIYVSTKLDRHENYSILCDENFFY